MILCCGRHGKNGKYNNTRSPPGPDLKLAALRACLTSFFATFGALRPFEEDQNEYNLQFVQIHAFYFVKYIFQYLIIFLKRVHHDHLDQIVIAIGSIRICPNLRRLLIPQIRQLQFKCRQIQL